MTHRDGATSLTFSGALRALDVDDLAAVVAGRPEACDLVAGGSLDLAALAGALSRPDGIDRAIAQLDQFRLRLLTVATWFSPAPSVASLRRQAPGVTVTELAAGARGLARRALAFPTGPPKSWSLWVPSCVRQLVEHLGEPGPRVRHALGERTVDDLVQIAGNLGIVWAKRPRKEAILDRLVAELSDEEALGRLLERAPAKALEALELVRDCGGHVPLAELRKAGLADYSDFGYWSSRASRPARQTPVAWLEAHALLLGDPHLAFDPGAGVFVPGEVEVALRGGTLYANWTTRPPAPDVVTGAAGGAERDPEQAVADAEALLHEWTSAPAPRLKTGGLGVRELRKAAQRTGIDERLVGFLYALLVEAQLLCYDGDVVTASRTASEWAFQTPAAKWATLFDAWRRALLWSESDDGPVALTTNPFLDHSGLRAAVLETLCEVPSGQAVTAASLARNARWRRPSLFHCDDCAEKLAHGVVAALTWLGTARADPTVELTEPGRSAVADPRWATRRNAAAAGFREPVSECTVQADMTVIVSGTPVPELGRGLARFAELKTASLARVYRITADSVRRALDLGATAADMTSLLERHAPKGVPQAVTYLIEDLARSHGRLTVGEGGVYVRADDPALLAGAVADRRMQKLDVEVLAPTVAVVHGATVSSLLKILRQAGYMPVDEKGGASIDRPRGREAPILRRAHGRTRPAPSAQQVRAAAEALSAGRVPAASRDDRRPISGRGPIVQALRRAQRGAGRIEIGYRGPTGVAVHRVEAFVVGRKQVSAWDVEDNRPRSFLIDRIQWVRAVNEADVEDLYGTG